MAASFPKSFVTIQLYMATTVKNCIDFFESPNLNLFTKHTLNKYNLFILTFNRNLVPLDFDVAASSEKILWCR